MEQIKLDIVPVGVAPVAHASQFDNGRQIRFNLFNQGTPYTLTGAETVTMVVNGEEENITNTSDDYVIWDVAEEDCAEVGVIGCEIRIVLGSMLIGSKNFFLEVEMDPYDGKNIRIVTVGPADICTFETTLPEPLQSVTVDITATGGNGTPDNPNPINGYTEANITRCGVNLWDEDWEVGNIDGTGADSPANDRIRSKGYIQVKGTNSIYLVIPTAVVIHKYSVDKSYLGNNYVASSGSFTIASDVAYIRFRTDTSYGTTYNNDISINYPSTDTAYHAYNGQTYTIAFGQTVYGGVLDVTRGKLTVKYGYVDLGSLNWIYATNPNVPQFRATLNNVGTTVATIPYNALCEAYPVISYNEMNDGSHDKTSSIFYASLNGINIADSSYSDTNSFKAAMNGIHLAYELATPFDIDLTPEVISAVVGENNVFADCGQTTVKYLKAE